jgi:hypothetical protein
MKEYLITLLPVLWAIVATAIALVLYRTSEGLFEEKIKSASTTRRIRLTGSSVIAALAFLGMAKATPERLMTSNPNDTVLLPVSDVRLLNDRMAIIEDQLMELEACVSVRGVQNCIAQLESLRTAISNVKVSVSRIKEPRERQRIQ